MKNLYRKYLNLEQPDRIMLLLIFTTICNIFFAVVKFMFAAILPSLWFFVNACFITVLSISRFFSLRNYGRQRYLQDEKKKRNWV